MSNLLKKFSKLTVKDWILIVFTFFWIFVLILDYLNKLEIYYYSLQYFRYFFYTFLLFAIGAFFSLYATGSLYFKKFPRFRFNGIAILFLAWVLVCSVVMAFNTYWKGPLTLSHYFHLSSRFLFTIVSVFLVVLASYSSGSLLLNKLLRFDPGTLNKKLMAILTGFMILSYLLLLMAAFGLLLHWLIWAVLALMLLFNYQGVFQFTKGLLWSEIKIPKDLNYWGALVFFGILFILVLDFFYTQSPFPLGFDARNYYVNIPKLLADSGSLVEGYQPYGWGIIMSIGYAAFHSAEITLSLSAIGGVLSIFAIYDLLHNRLSVNSNWSLFAALVFITIPAVNNQMIIEFKIDLALLFLHLVLLSTVLSWLKAKSRDSKEVLNSLTKEDYKFLVLLGLVIGFSLSIKVLSIIFIFPLLLLLWWFEDKDLIGTISLGMMGIAVMILAKLDQISGLRDYHTNPDLIAKIALAFGLIGFVYSIYLKKHRLIQKTKLAAIVVIFCFLSFSPWMYKNYLYAGNLSLQTLIIGRNPRPVLTVPDLENNYRQYQNSQSRQPE